MGGEIKAWHIIVPIVLTIVVFFIVHCCTAALENKAREARETNDESQEEATKVTTDPEQMVQLIQIEQGPLEAELRSQLFNSNVNQGGVDSRPSPGAQHIVRLDSQQMELLQQVLNQQQNTNQESIRISRPSAPAPETQSTNDQLPPSYDEYMCERGKFSSE